MGVVPPTSKDTTDLIPPSSKGRSCIFNDDWVDFVDRAHSRHSELTREKIKYTLISMRQHAFQSRTPLTFPSNEENDA